MITSIRGTGILLLLFAATFAAPGYASGTATGTAGVGRGAL